MAKNFLGTVLSSILILQPLFSNATIESLKSITPEASPYSLPLPPLSLAEPMGNESIPNSMFSLPMEIDSSAQNVIEDKKILQKEHSLILTPLANNRILMNRNEPTLKGKEAQQQHAAKNSVEDARVHLNAAANLAHSQEKTPPSDFNPAAQSSRWSKFWSGEKETARDNAISLAAKPWTARLHLKTLGKITAVPLFLSAIPTPAFAATAAAHHAAGIVILKTYLMAGGFLALTYGMHRVIPVVIHKISKRLHWKPDTTDNVHFISSTANWLLGLTLVLHSFGVSGNVLFTTAGIAFGLAVNKTLGNLMHAALFVINRPFNFGEKLRIGSRLYEVIDLQPKYATLKFLGIAPGAAASDPPDLSPEYSYFTYSQLSDKSIELYRPYTGFDGKISFRPLLYIGLKPIAEGLRTLNKSSYVKAFLWGSGILLLGGVLPILKAHVSYHFIAVMLPYLQSLFALSISSAAARFLEKFIPLIGKYSKWNEKTTAQFRLALQIASYLIGISISIGALGISIGTLAVGLGVGTAAFTLASSNILGNIAQAVSLRWQSPFRMGDTVQIGSERGQVAEIGLFYVVLKTGEKQHILIPYSQIENNELVVQKQTQNQMTLGDQ